MDDSRPLLPFVALGTLTEKKQFVLEASFCALNNERDYINFLNSQLASVGEDSFMTFVEEPALGNWFIKAIKSGVYVVCTTVDYPKFIAIEALDEHFETAKGHVRSKWRPEKRKNNMIACCQGLSGKWGTMEAGSAAYILMTEVDNDARVKYSEKVDALMAQITKVKATMHDNLQNQLANMEDAEQLHQKSQEALEEAAVFKKKTASVKSKMRNKNNKLLAIGTGGAATVGLTLGLLVGGPVGAAILTPVFAVGFLGASGAMSDWGLSQKMVVLKGGGGGNNPNASVTSASS